MTDIDTTDAGDHYVCRWRDSEGLPHRQKIPRALHDAFMALVNQSSLDGYASAIEQTRDQLRNLHQPHTSAIDARDYCTECDNRYPCATLRLLGYTDRKDTVDKNDDGIKIETKEGGIVQHMQPAVPQDDDEQEGDDA